MLGNLFKKTAAAATSSSGQRMFSRADIIKGLDRTKVSRRVFIKKELTENPEFFKAFPHMQVVLGPKNENEDAAAKAKADDKNADN